MVENGQTELVLDRHDGLLETALFPGLSRAALAFHRIGVDIIAAEAVLGGDQIGGNALGHDIMIEADLRIDAHGTAIGTHRHATHRFNTGTDREIGFAAHHLGGGEIDRFQAGSAETIDLETGGAFSIAGIDHGRARNVRALLTNRRNTAHDDIIDQCGVEPVAIADRLQLLGRELQRGDRIERPVLLLAARRANGVIDVSFGHVTSFPVFG